MDRVFAGVMARFFDKGVASGTQAATLLAHANKTMVRNQLPLRSVHVLPWWMTMVEGRHSAVVFVIECKGGLSGPYIAASFLKVSGMLKAHIYRSEDRRLANVAFTDASDSRKVMLDLDWRAGMPFPSQTTRLSQERVTSSAVLYHNNDGDSLPGL